MMSNRHGPRRRTKLRKACAALACAVLGVGGVAIVRAVENIALEIERVDGAGWWAEGITLDLALPEHSVATHATIARLGVANRAQTLRNVRVSCPALALDGLAIKCPNARIAVTMPEAGEQRLQGALSYHRGTGALDLDLRGDRLAGGTLRMRASLRQQGWHVSAELVGVQIEQALQLAAAAGVPAAPLTVSGRISASIEASGRDTQLRRATIDATFDELTANNASGTLASDKLGVTLRSRLDAQASGWRVDATLRAMSGQAYAEPVFLDFAQHALTLQMRGVLENAQRFTSDAFSIDHTNVLRAEGSARIDLSEAQPVRDLRVSLHALQFPGAYTSYLQPFLIDTDFKSLTTTGQLSGSLHVDEGVPRRGVLRLADVGLDDGTQKFVLRGLTGAVSWQQAGEDDSVLRDGSERSVLAWQGGSLLNLPLGPGRFLFATVGRDFRLLEPTQIPLVDGAIDLESLRIRNAGLPSVAFMVDATVQPISVAQLCRAFGWPEFGGSIGGTISKLRLRDGIVTLGTTLQAEVFDGSIAISDLRLEDALGTWPRFYSSISLENLDLELVTRAFSFGRITGRLSGAINELQLFNWQPIAFDARLYTPRDDRSRHRISQRAVENIGSIGGGGSGITQALSGGVLRFFDEFRYERLGLSCRLENEICHMEGIAPAPNGGYYLVKGSGLPRIDVIGSARRVDWPRLVQQLIAITESEGPIVQ